MGSNPGLAFDLAKTLLESACKTVLVNRGFAFDDGWDLPKLLKETVGRLRLVPEGLGDAAEAESSVRKTVGGLQTVVQGICELRNTHGFASHGKEASFQQLESIQALLVARAADAVVNFLFSVHRNYPAAVLSEPLGYSNHPAFNEHIDEAHTLVQIFDLAYRPSEVLFQMDPQAYRHYLADFEPTDAVQQDARPDALKTTGMRS